MFIEISETSLDMVKSERLTDDAENFDFFCTDWGLCSDGIKNTQLQSQVITVHCSWEQSSPLF
jgi:hypothetical protein